MKKIDLIKEAIPTKKDIFYEKTIQVVGCIPNIGSFFELITRLFCDPLKERQDRFNLLLAEVVEFLYKEINILPDTLMSNKKFISGIYQAALIAIKNHQEEKLLMLKNALISTVILDIDDDIVFRFYRMIDDLTVSHIYILKWINENIGFLSNDNNLNHFFTLFQDYCKTKIDRIYFRLCIYDLERNGLINIGNMTDYDEFNTSVVSWENDNREFTLLNLGHDFIKFVSDYGAK